MKIDDLKIESSMRQQDGYAEERFVILDPAGMVVDDAGGYGYKTRQKAHRAMWYRFGGGKKKIGQNVGKLKQLFTDHPGIRKAIDAFYEYGYKELARGEITEDDLLTEIEKDYGVKMGKGMLKTYLDNDKVFV